jgi:hypothetical protein
MQRRNRLTSHSSGRLRRRLIQALGGTLKFDVHQVLEASRNPERAAAWAAQRAASASEDANNLASKQLELNAANARAAQKAAKAASVAAIAAAVAAIVSAICTVIQMLR